MDRAELVLALKAAIKALGDAYNHLSPETDPVLCVAEGRVTAALESAEAALDMVKP